MFREITPDEAAPLLRYHYCPQMPANPRHCYGIEAGGAIIAAAVWCPISAGGRVYIEFAAMAKDPRWHKLQISSLISYSCNQLRRYRYGLAVTFVEADRSEGKVFSAASWEYAGIRRRHPAGIRLLGDIIDRPEDGAVHIYWKALNRFGKHHAKRLNLAHTGQELVG